RGPVHALACDESGHFLAVLRSANGESGQLTSYQRRLGAYWSAATRMVTGPGGIWLSPLAVPSDGDHLLALHDGDRLVLLRGTGMLSEGEVAQPFDIGGLSALLLLPVPDSIPPKAVPFAVAFDAIMPCNSVSDPSCARLGARPGFRARSSLRSTSLA